MFFLLFEFFEFVFEIENKMGRKRFFKWGLRNIDIDIFFYDDCVIDIEKFKIFYLEFYKRLFVFEFFCEIEKDFIYFVFKKSVYEFYIEFIFLRKE